LVKQSVLDTICKREYF